MNEGYAVRVAPPQNYPYNRELNVMPAVLQGLCAPRIPIQVKAGTHPKKKRTREEWDYNSEEEFAEEIEREAEIKRETLRKTRHLGR